MHREFVSDTCNINVDGDFDFPLSCFSEGNTLKTSAKIVFASDVGVHEIFIQPVTTGGIALDDAVAFSACYKQGKPSVFVLSKALILTHFVDYLEEFFKIGEKQSE